MDVTDPCVSCGMRQRIPTLNLNLILNPKLDLISKLITDDDDPFIVLTETKFRTL